MDKIKTEALIIGAGVIGLACGKYLSKNGIDTIVIEKSNAISDGVSSRNSGVIHSGIYYKNNSLKAKLCVEGKRKLYKYALEKKINHKQVGKIIFGSFAEEKKLIQLYKNGIANGLKELRLLQSQELKKLEPNLKADIGLLVSDTGIIDVTEYAFAMVDDIEKNNSFVSKNSELNKVDYEDHLFKSNISTGSDNFLIESKYLIVACGLESYEVSKRISCIKNNKKIKKLNFTKGHYFKINGEYPFNHLIYPLPNKFSLGIHSSFDLAGNTRFGPDAVQVEEVEYSFLNGTKEKFISEIGKYWPQIKNKNLYEDYVGIRPKTQSPDGSFEDFSILTNKDHDVSNLFFLQGIESPGLTSSLAIGEYIYKLIRN